MNSPGIMSKISASLELMNGDRIVVVDRLDDPFSHSPDEMHRNLFRVSSVGEVVWQVGNYNHFGNSTFTNVYQKADGIFAHNFDGVEYEIVDVERGDVKPRALTR